MSDDDSSQGANPAFALTPATAVGGVIDYTTAAGRKLYSSATAKLEEDSFDCCADDLYAFLKALKDRAREFGWDEPGIGIMSIPNDPINPVTFRSLIDHHGEISLEELLEFERTYAGAQNRSAQDSAQLYRCLMASISRLGKKKILVWEDQYTINGLGSGNLLLKIVVRESHLDTNATSASIRTKLTDLDKYLPTIGHDIVKFNTYVKLLIDGLRSRGETTQDLLINLFKGYMACSDREFIAYIKRKQDAFEEGMDIEPDQLMKNAADKYKTLLQKGSWNAPDANEEKILALQSEIRKLKKKSTAGNGKANKKAKTSNEKPSWFNERPKTADLHKSKEWNGKTWWFCHPDTGGKCDGKYHIHKPSQCQGTGFRFEKKTETKTNKHKSKKENSNATKTANDQRTLKLNKAFRAAAAIVERDEHKSDSSETEDE